MNIKGFVIVLL